MATRDLFHGANGDNILQIMSQGAMKPDSQGTVFLSPTVIPSSCMAAIRSAKPPSSSNSP